MKRLLPSFVLILLGLRYLSSELLSPSKQKPVKRNEQESPVDNHHDIPVTQQSERSSIDSLVAQPSSHDDQWRNEQKRYWERQICLSKWLNWVTGIAAAIALSGLYFVYLQADSSRIAAEASKISADIANQTLQASRRPWVDIEMTVAGEESLLTKDGEIRAPIKYKTTNHGSSPAVGVWLHTAVELYAPGFDVAREQLKICDMGQAEPPAYAFGGHILFPGRSFEIIVSHVISKSGVQNSLQAWEAATGHPVDILVPFIIGCVTYRYTFDSTIHKTPVMAKLVKKNPNVRGDVPTLASDSKLNLRANAGPIPLNSIFVTPEITMSGIRAD